ncbi:MAG: aminopeptidase P family protein [Thermosynechococcaceae cyanobacterium]
MIHPNLSSESVTVLRQRRQALGDRLTNPVLLWSGGALSRNFPANVYPFRASSHFLYFAGVSLPNAVIYLHQGQLTLLMDDAPAADALWHGTAPTRCQIAAQIGATAYYPLAQLADLSHNTATIPVQDPMTRHQQRQILGRSLGEAHELSPLDQTLAEVLIQLRLRQDAGAIAAIRQAVEVTIQAHRAGMARTSQAQTEAQIRVAMEGEIGAANMVPAYGSIVTVHGEVLHQPYSSGVLAPGDLLLADVGAEHPLGWASDVTRTWPVSGQWSPSQRAVYAVVLAAHDACIAQMAPGVEFRDLHLTAEKVMAEGLVDLKILKGDPVTLVERGAVALFFPHGVGHLLGLDVHDMEDLGDLAGYAPGRTRCDRDGLRYLRLDRPLQPDMVVTIEPGFYQVPAILQDPQRRARFADCVDWDRLADFQDVRGIRIEDDVQLTETGCMVLSAALPTRPEEIEACLY